MLGSVGVFGENGGVIETSLQTSAVSHPYLSRLVTDGSNRIEWLRARARGITATDVAKLSTQKSIDAAAWAKLHGTGFSGNAFTEHGRAREPEIAAWVQQEFGILPSAALFHAQEDRRHLATPDGIGMIADGSTAGGSGMLVLSEIKTTNKAWRGIPKNYLRQVWWQQYVLGAERTLVVWEEHRDFVPVGDPKTQWVDRDENEIAQLVWLANQLIETLIERSSR